LGTGPERADSQIRPMREMPYRKLDAWKVCHDLCLAVYRATDKLEDGRDGGLVGDLRLAALLAPAKLAHGSARGSTKAFQRFVDLTLGYLSEISYNLELARAIGTIPEDTVKELDALRGRAAFYTWKLYLSLLPQPPDAAADSGRSGP
jgi:four helix bundle protein